MTRMSFARCALGAMTLALAGTAFAAPDDARSAPPPDKSLSAWLERLHEAARRRAYIGTFVVSSGAEMAASKIWHVCDGSQQYERIETLTGAPRTTIRRNDEVVTFAPDLKVALRERREALRLFPDLLRNPGQPIEALYSARGVGQERVAGYDALVVDFVPKDALRYGYRIWSEKATGLVLKLQTRDAAGQVLEQVAFTELQLDAPVKMDALARQMENTAGYQVVKPELRKTTPEAEGWRLKADVAGFQSMSCHSRREPAARATPAVQWVFSDGLASVSLFLETFDAKRHTKEKVVSAGATHSVSRRLGEHWVTAMGEVPPETLGQFVQALERTR
ncbi:transcriptional regulator [Aquabacterium sp. A08]|nr:transcriptional regulator [Aquabacterium sp. A08]